MSIKDQIRGQAISEEAVQMAFDYLKDGSDGIAAARANVLRMEYKVKKVKARLVFNADGPMTQREAFAVQHPDYDEATEEHVKAVEVWEFASDQRNRAQLVIEAWRSQQASQRSLGRVG